MTNVFRMNDAELAEYLIGIAQNDYMIDNHFLEAGRALILAATRLRKLEDVKPKQKEPSCPGIPNTKASRCLTGPDSPEPSTTS